MRILVILGVFVSTFAFSQLAEPLVGAEYSTAKKENFSGFLGENNLSIFTADYSFYSRRKQELLVRKFYKGDLLLTDSKNIFTEILDGFTNEPEEIFYQNGKLFLFSKLFSDRDKTQLLAVEVFSEDCERLSYSIIDTLLEDQLYYVEESEDKDGFLFAKHLKFTQLVEQEINLVKIKSDGSTDWKFTVRSPMALQNLRIEKIRFKGNSTIYILCNYAFDLLSSTEVTDQLVNNKYALWAFNSEDKFLKEFEIRIKNKWVNGIDMTIDPSNRLLVSGYFNETKNPSINGVFSLRINEKLKLLNTTYRKFDDDIFDKFLKNDDNKKIKELDDYEMKELALMSDGSYFILGEQFYKYVERSYDPRTNITTTTEHFNYNSIIVSYFDSLGNHKWTDRIPKAQNSTNDYGYFSSFASLNNGNEIYLFFNDARKNNESVPTGYFDYTNLFNNRRFQISYVQVNKKGVQNRGGLLDDKNDLMLRAKLSGQLNSNSIYLITENSRSSAVMRVAVKEN